MSMFGGMASPSLADIAAVTGNNNRDNGGLGGENGIWVLIILFALFGGWGNRNGGYDGGSGGSRGETTIVNVPTPTAGFNYGGMGMMGNGFEAAAVQRGFDSQTVKLDGISNGICSLGYDQLAQMNGINSNIMQSSFGIQQAINDNTVAGMRNTNDLSTQISDCCCKTQTSFMNAINQMDKATCALGTNIHQTGDAIIQNQNQGFQMLNNTIRDGFCNLEMREMQRENADLRQRLNNCDRDNALQSMSNYIVGSLNPPARPAYIVQNPNCCTGPIPVTVQNNSGCSRCGNTSGFYAA